MHVITTVHGALERAAHIIEQRGWTQCTEESPQGICLLYALELAAQASTLRTGLLRPPLYAVLGLPPLGSNLMVWNDTPGRTKSEVLAALRAAAMVAKASVNVTPAIPQGASSR